MPNFPRWKIVLVIMICLAGIVTALPNFFSDAALSRLPSWVPWQKINLGLDLQGGSHLLLEVDVDAVVEKELDDLTDQMRRELRAEKIGYTALGASRGAANVTVRDAADVERAAKLIRDMAAPVQASFLGGIASPSIDVSVEGAQIRVTMTEAAILDRKRNTVAQSIEVVRRRVDETGMREPVIQRQGDDRILVQLPGVGDPDRIEQILKATAQLTFRFIDTTLTAEEAARGRVPPGAELLPSDLTRNPEGPAEWLVRKQVMVSGENLKSAAPSFDQYGQPVVSIGFDSIGARRFADATRENVGKLFAMVLDGKVLSAPRINEPILQGSAQISGNFTVAEAQDLALLLRAGALPAPMTVLEKRTVGPDLGADSIAAGEIAGVIGTIAVIVFMFVVYGLFGLFANIVLVINILMLLGVLSLFQATLTLPGIAGIVLTIGMAVDANVIVFERVREEARAGKTPFSALEAGYQRAYTTIVDANLTTIIAAVILYMVGTGPVRGFAVTLMIGVVTSVFTAVTVCRMMGLYWVVRRRPKTLPI